MTFLLYKCEGSEIYKLLSLIYFNLIHLFIFIILIQFSSTEYNPRRLVVIFDFRFKCEGSEIYTLLSLVYFYFIHSFIFR